MKKPFQLNHVAVHVADLERSKRFYHEVIGLEEMPRPDFDMAGAWYRIGEDQELHIIANSELPPPVEARGVHFALQIDDGDAFHRHLEEKGIPHRGPNPRPDGARQIFLRDPDGHLIELSEL